MSKFDQEYSSSSKQDVGLDATEEQKLDPKGEMDDKNSSLTEKPDESVWLDNFPFGGPSSSPSSFLQRRKMNERPPEKVLLVECRAPTMVDASNPNQPTSLHLVEHQILEKDRGYSVNSRYFYGNRRQTVLPLGYFDTAAGIKSQFTGPETVPQKVHPPPVNPSNLNNPVNLLYLASHRPNSEDSMASSKASISPNASGPSLGLTQQTVTDDRARNFHKVDTYNTNANSHLSMIADAAINPELYRNVTREPVNQSNLSAYYPISSNFTYNFLGQPMRSYYVYPHPVTTNNPLFYGGKQASQVNENTAAQLAEDPIFDGELSDIPSDYSCSDDEDLFYVLRRKSFKKHRMERKTVGGKKSLIIKLCKPRIVESGSTRPSIRQSKPKPVFRRPKSPSFDSIDDSRLPKAPPKDFLKAGIYALEYKLSPKSVKKHRNLQSFKEKMENFKFELPVNFGKWCLENESDFRLSFDIAHRFRHKYDENTFPVAPEPWTKIRSNIYTHRRRRFKLAPVCLCQPQGDGQLGCGEDCINRATFIECSDNCPLGELCSNKAFQRKQEVKELEVFHTKDKRGFGLRTLVDIPAGVLVKEYRGEIITYDNCLERMSTVYKKNKCFYFLDYCNGEVIDGTVKGTEVRFVNHSCDPNCHIEKWQVEGEICVGLFSSKNIAAGSELTYDYNFHNFGNFKHDCLCGSEKCRGLVGKSSENTNSWASNRRKKT